MCGESRPTNRITGWPLGSLVRPGGSLIVSALKGATCYSVGSRTFPAVDISEDDLTEVLVESGFPEKRVSIRTILADRPARLYAGVIMAVAVKASDERVARASRC